MVKEGRPRRGSLAFVRKRARSIIPRVRSWPEETGVLGFLGYKVGMVTVMGEITNPHSRLKGQEIAVPATVVEVPPLILRGVRTYRRTPYGARVISEGKKPKEGDFYRLLFETQPKLAGLPKKSSEIIEIGFGGDFESVKNFVSEKMGKEIRVDEVFQPGMLVDVIGVTKGKGFAGVVKRFGVALISHKAEKSRRKVGSLGPWTPKRTPWQVPMAGQLGFFLRTEYNKEILAIGNGEQINPSGGWHRYGLIKSQFMLLKGSVPGAIKRPIKIRKAIRSPKSFHPIKIKEIVVRKEVKRL